MVIWARRRWQHSVHTVTKSKLLLQAVMAGSPLNLSDCAGPGEGLCVEWGGKGREMVWYGEGCAK
jgi:hypothetical protein